MNPNALVEIRSLRVILLNPNACPTLPQPHSALTGPTRLFPSNLIESQCRSNPSPAPLNPNRPYSAPLCPNRPHAAPLGLSLSPGQCMPNPSPTPLSTNRPYSALLGPTRPHAAPLGLHAQPLPSPTQPYSALLGPTRPAPRGSTWPILVARA